MWGSTGTYAKEIFLGLLHGILSAGTQRFILQEKSAGYCFLNYTVSYQCTYMGLI